MCCVRRRGTQSILQPSLLQGLIFTRFTIGRKHKDRRGEPQDKNWRNADKGRSKNKNRGKVGRHSKMGQEESRLIDEKTPPETLKSRTLEAVAEYIKDGRARRIVVMVGLSRAPSLRTTLTAYTDRCRHQHLGRHTRLSLARDRPLRKPPAPQSSLRRSRLRYWLLSRESPPLLHSCSGAVSRQLPTDHHPLLHNPAASERTPAETLHPEH